MKPTRKTTGGHPSGRGFTLVELLVVITIIGILISLLLPAVQSARESARKMQCSNHLRQLAQGCLLHENTHHFLPSGGWGFMWTGDPDRGFGKDQPGSWIYSVLSYIEQGPLHDLGADGDPRNETPAQRAGAARRISTPLPVLFCPTRRPPVAMTSEHTQNVYTKSGGQWCLTPHGSDPARRVAKNDYAACTGDNVALNYTWGPNSLADADNKTYIWNSQSMNFTDQGDDEHHPEYMPSGVIYCHSEVSIAQIPDGTTNTYMLGEKWMDVDNYVLREPQFGNGESAYGGPDDDTNCSAWSNFQDGIEAATYPSYAPRQDAPGTDKLGQCFGSAHPSGMNMVMCDGSVQMIRYEIDLKAHRRLANRHDGLTVDPKSL